MLNRIDIVMYLVEYGHACPIIRDKNRKKPVDYASRVDQKVIHVLEKAEYDMKLVYE